MMAQNPVRNCIMPRYAGIAALRTYATTKASTVAGVTSSPSSVSRQSASSSSADCPGSARMCSAIGRSIARRISASTPNVGAGPAKSTFHTIGCSRVGTRKVSCSARPRTMPRLSAVGVCALPLCLPDAASGATGTRPPSVAVAHSSGLRYACSKRWMKNSCVGPFPKPASPTNSTDRRSTPATASRKSPWAMRVITASSRVTAILPARPSSRRVKLVVPASRPTLVAMISSEPLSASSRFLRMAMESAPRRSSASCAKPKVSRPEMMR
mmetsp:Transcript_14850/g.46048  ORF Transcript_14850/g.46048 Transcript_14850/m.46048 type:complete len:269 (+) Transcript_14850:217-1023(+)